MRKPRSGRSRARSYACPSKRSFQIFGDGEFRPWSELGNYRVLIFNYHDIVAIPAMLQLHGVIKHCDRDVSRA
jgi:hypothetical protein